MIDVKSRNFQSIWPSIERKQTVVVPGDWVKSNNSPLAYARISTQLEITRRLEKAKEFIDKNYHGQIFLRDISTEACISVHHFKRLFKKQYKITPHQYVNALRLEKAKDLLRNTTMHVGDICYFIGFRNTSSFIRLFRLTFGITPAIYRKISLALNECDYRQSA